MKSWQERPLGGHSRNHDLAVARAKESRRDLLHTRGVQQVSSALFGPGDREVVVPGMSAERAFLPRLHHRGSSVCDSAMNVDDASRTIRQYATRSPKCASSRF